MAAGTTHANFERFRDLHPFAFRNFPLQFHPLARPAAEAAMCAGQQGKFWEAHDAFFGGQNHLSDLTSQLPERLALDVDQFKSCLEGEGRNQVDVDVKSGKDLRIAGTPITFVGLRQPNGLLKVTAAVDGARGLPDFRTAIDEALKKAESNR